MSTSRRLQLENITFTTVKDLWPHAGLWLDKYLTIQPALEKNRSSDQDTAYAQLVKECSQIKEPFRYKIIYKQWRQTMADLGIQTRVARINGRLAIGLGNESVIETAVTLHHTYGVPFIPGSALKGTASSYAHQYLNETIWQKGSDAHNTLFGSTESAGFVTFFDALPVPHSLSENKWRLKPDVMTVHHPDYYQGQDKAPADWDSPTPIPFLTVTGDFLIALHAPDAPGWADVAYGILKQALQEIGIGAKTSSGYGRAAYAPPKGYERGRVKNFGTRGPDFGFIVPQDTQEEIFVHRNDLREGIVSLNKDDIVDYRVERDAQGRKQAKDVHFS
ncbi:MAG: type III-B CRISPR module RAMP protein Cmr6 [Chloroflexi bacterium]|nr:type III-B CRISPR module RAMP protein Cmr6 [Chloroflexota bacterium]